MLGRTHLHPETANAQAALRHLTGARDLAGHDKRYDDAFEAYSNALRIAPGNNNALLRRAAVAVATEDTESALAGLDTLSDASNEHPMALHLRGS
jgi:tetratricopeptide (TPR) repeat protein